MKICLVLYDMQDFGGLEEIATTLVVELKTLGHNVSVLSSSWVSPDNQYLRRLHANDVRYVQVPKWLSQPASHRPTKTKILDNVMGLLKPIIYFSGFLLFIAKNRSWHESIISAHGWFHGQLLSRFIGPDWREPITRVLLSWWKIRWRPELIHIHGYTTNLLFVIDWAYNKKLPIVYVENQTPDSQFDWWSGFNEKINKASVVVAASERSAQALQTVCGVTQPIVVFHPNVEDPMKSGSLNIESLNHRKQALNVTTVARLSIAKGIFYLLEAIVLVQKFHPATQFKIYGDGDLRLELMSYAKELGLDGNAIFVGAFTDRNELSEIMGKTDIFVMSSLLEGQPLSLVEAMAFGRPIIATTVGGIPELIRESVNGMLCEPRDSECLARKINTLIENPTLRNRLGREARLTYEQGPFHPTSVCEQFNSIYMRVLQQERFKVAPQQQSISR